MIVSSNGRWVVDGGVNPDPDSIWSLDTASGQVHRHSFADGRWVRLFPGRSDHFAAARYGNDLIDLAVYGFDAGLSEPLARISVEPDRITSLGDVTAWTNVPRAFPGFRPLALDEPSTTRSAPMLVIDRQSGTTEIDDLDWFRKGGYDRDYQAPEAPVEVPGSTLLLIPVTRRSQPILYDPALRRVVGHLELVGPGRVSVLQVGPQPDVIWAWGDELIRARPRDGGLLDEECLMAKGRIESTVVTTGPIADVAFDMTGARAMVGILHSGEVLDLDPKSLNLAVHLRTGFVWPHVAILGEGRVIVRDAITGEVQGIG